MAKKRKPKPKAQAPQGSDKKGETEGLLHGLLTVLLSILIVLVVFGGAFYYVLKNNIYGLGEQFRPRLTKIPVLKQALPPLPETEDPYDPKYLTQAELMDNYNALREEKADLTEKLEQAEKRVQELEEEKNQWVAIKKEAQAEKQANEELLKQIEDETAQLETVRKDVSRLIAEGDTEGFKQYFEKIDSQNAEELYLQVVSEDVTNQQLKALSKTYEEMEPANAANILTELGGKDMELLIDIAGAMKSDIAAEIIENMDPEFAADLLQKLADKKLEQQ